MGNAALLAARTGPGRLTTVEVVVGDGVRGRAEGGPYDRVVATYAVEEVPWAWVEQTRPGGRIVAPWGRLGHVTLTVADDGRSASGWMQGLATFMPSRGVDQGLPWDRGRGDAAPEADGPFARDVRACMRTAACCSRCVSPCRTSGSSRGPLRV
ncbi:protein-L-isoaspartate O-methyltransferase [Streptomyces sp. NPDC088258]|uniref:protein-L-isoaspartate O-methyltransferase family protein n=1 Tax=Streptomyces sp. NPDC088258 TaxID=3365849 RepID=UPI00380264F3